MTCSTSAKFRDTRGLGDRAVKGLVRLMEGVAVAGAACFALALQVGDESDDLAASRPLGREPRRRLFQRLADDNRLGQRGERDARYNVPDCGKISTSPSSASLRTASRTGVRLNP